MTEWISVKDRSPEKGMFVCLIGKKMFFGCTQDKNGNIEKIMDIMYANKGIIKLLEDDFHTILRGWIKPPHYGEVTHWMPLPEVPT